MASAARRLRALLNRPGIIQAPGAYDALSAKIVAAAGFEVVYMTGYGASAGLLAQPDVGLLTLTEMVDNARRIVQAAGVPVIADADTGYGNPLNVMRTVRAYEDAGVAGLHLEDQVAPKKCGHMEGKQVISAAEMMEKVRAAIQARRDSDFVIIARTDARAPLGLEEAIRRGRLYVEAGADVAFIEAPESREEVTAVAHAFRNTPTRTVPLLYNWAEGGKTPYLPLREIEALGYKLVLFPVSALYSAARAMRDTMADIQRDGTPHHALTRMVGFAEFNDFLGMPAIRRLEEEFRTREEPPVRPAVPAP